MIHFGGLLSHLRPAKIVVLGYLFYSIVGAVVLSMPFCLAQPLPILDIFFTSIAAVSTTGLSTIDLWPSYTFTGQIVILILIQLGGIGYMTFGSFVMLCTAQKLSAYRKKIGASTFAFPKDFSIHEFISSVILFSFLCELVGAIFLSLIFWKRGVDTYIWHGVFHSVSAFCTAGMSLFRDSFVSFKDNIWFNLIISILAVLGSMGFIVSLDFYQRITGKKEALSFTTKVILSMTLLFLLVGTILFFFLAPEKGQTVFEEWMIGLFQVISATTTMGFYTVDISTFNNSMLILLTILSTFGSAPSGTGGGLKNTAFTTLVAFVKNTLKGKPVSIWNHEIPSKRVKYATVAFIYYIFTLSMGVFLLSISEKQDISAIFFEAANALNNSGLSVGITSKLTIFGKVLICILMLLGRVGVLTFGIAISSQKDDKEYKYEKAELIV